MESISKELLINELKEQSEIQFNAVKNCLAKDCVDLNKVLVETSKLQAIQRLQTYFANKKYEKKKRS